ncbi:MAG TPA: phosphoribosylanthranilate isomerase [Pyrinomonadaceae bacterium]|nr:phosphoribosylanthranilate isomerase [Pyrinomonadaceae bacterium]HNU07915.1 phosphoribosylanthranilate isomerase [Pyrinomonadaceae bacterium]
MTPRIKICCISNVSEATAAVSAGASAIGLVGRMPSGPGVIADELIAEIARSVPPPVGTFLLTSESRADEVVAHHRRVHTDTIQLVDALEERDYDSIRSALPTVRLVQVIHVIDQGSVDEACAVAPHVDAVLLDSGNPNLQVKELGGTGRVHNWELSRKIVETCGKPVFLAGGIKASNVREAYERVGPFGFDLCSSVRTDGRLDPRKLGEFFESLEFRL